MGIFGMVVIVAFAFAGRAFFLTQLVEDIFGVGELYFFAVHLDFATGEFFQVGEDLFIGYRILVPGHIILFHMVGNDLNEGFLHFPLLIFGSLLAEELNGFAIMLVFGGAVVVRHRVGITPEGFFRWRFIR